MKDFREDIQVLILTHNRQHCLDKVLPYWEHKGFNTLVVDQSSKPFDKFKDFKLLNYHYLDEPFAQRCALAAKEISSKYTVIISDDELYLPSGLKKIWENMERNDNLVSVGGVALAIWNYGPQVCGAWPYRRTYRLTNYSSSVIARISKHTGNGINPITSFFTSNLTRSDVMKNCLNLYSKAKSIATEAISLLTICGGGPSAYIDSLYWIRNWNQLPRSHKGWDRELLIHDWWATNKDSEIGKEFRKDLVKVFSSFANPEDFDVTWSMIMKASRLSQPSSVPKGQINSEILMKTLNYSKWLLKLILKSESMPKSYTETLNEMKSQGVGYWETEVEEAVGVIRTLYPYKKWK